MRSQTNWFWCDQKSAHARKKYIFNISIYCFTFESYLSSLIHSLASNKTDHNERNIPYMYVDTWYINMNERFAIVSPLLGPESCVYETIDDKVLGKSRDQAQLSITYIESVNVNQHQQNPSACVMAPKFNSIVLICFFIRYAKQWQHLLNTQSKSHITYHPTAIYPYLTTSINIRQCHVPRSQKNQWLNNSMTCN